MTPKKQRIVTLMILLCLIAMGYAKADEGDECPSGLVAGPFPGGQDAPSFGRITAMVPDGGKFDEDPEVLYMTDSVGQVIYKIRKTESGTQVEPLAGRPDESGFADGSGQDARFDGPVGITVEYIFGEDVFVADTGNKAIRRIDPDSGKVTTIVGGPDSDTLSRPLGVAFGIIDIRERLAVIDYDKNALFIVDLEQRSAPIIETIPFQGPKRVDWWADLRSEDPPRGMAGEIVVASETGVYRVRRNEDGDFDKEQIAPDTNVNSVFGDDRGNVYFTTEDNIIKVIRHRGEYYDVPEPLVACGPEIRSAQSVATFFGTLVVAGKEGDSSQLNVIKPKNGGRGLPSTCSRCGVVTPK